MTQSRKTVQDDCTKDKTKWRKALTECSSGDFDYNLTLTQIIHMKPLHEFITGKGCSWHKTIQFISCRLFSYQAMEKYTCHESSHEHCSTHHQRSLSHHWTLTQLQITLLDYISHHSLHPHSCFTLSRCTCSQSLNHPHTILTLNILPHAAEYC